MCAHSANYGMDLDGAFESASRCDQEGPMFVGMQEIVGGT
jgi:hypothetical protein